MVNDVWSDFEAARIPAAPERRVQTLEEALSASETLGLPVLLRLENRFSMRVDHAGDLPLAWAKAEKVCPKGIKRIQTVVEGMVCRVMGFQLKRDFLPIEILGLRLQEGPFPVPMSMTAPAALSSRVYGEVLQLARKAGRAAMPPTGPVEMDFVIAASGVVLSELHSCKEIDPMVARLMELSLGMNLNTATKDVAAGRYPNLTPRRGLGAACVWIDGTSGVVERVEGLAEIQAITGIVEVALKAQPGDTLGHITSINERDKIGWILAVAPTAAAALEAAGEAGQRLKLVTRKIL